MKVPTKSWAIPTHTYIRDSCDCRLSRASMTPIFLVIIFIHVSLALQ
jgi:hypothetical protein